MNIDMTHEYRGDIGPLRTISRALGSLTLNWASPRVIVVM